MSCMDCQFHEQVSEKMAFSASPFMFHYCRCPNHPCNDGKPLDNPYGHCSSHKHKVEEE